MNGGFREPVVCQYWTCMRLACLVCICMPVFGQTASVSPTTKGRGEKLTLEITADSQPGRVPIALRWNLIVPAGLMEMDSGGPEPGSAAKTSGKSLQCTSRRPYLYICSLAGGNAPIADGQVAIFHFTILKTAAPGTTALKIENAVAISASGHEDDLDDKQSVVIIQ
jgi:hypothetical protein